MVLSQHETKYGTYYVSDRMTEEEYRECVIKSYSYEKILYENNEWKVKYPEKYLEKVFYILDGIESITRKSHAYEPEENTQE